MSEKLKCVTHQPPSTVPPSEVVFACTGMSISELVEDMHNNPDKYTGVLVAADPT